MISTHPHKITYKAPIRDIAFLLWEQFRLQDDPRFGSAAAREAIEANLAMARNYSEGPLAQSYRETDEQEAWLNEAGRVVLPDSYPKLLAAYREIWANWQAGSAQGMAPPPILQNLLVEMFMSGNASFMTYVGFSQPALSLLGTHGSAALNAAFRPALESLDATACLCLTEQDAGSDLSRIRTLATKQEAGHYLMTGHKWLISAGSHELTDNIYYFVLCRTDPNQTGMVGLSCFLVPRYRLDAEGRPCIDNGIRIRQVVQKMGFKGCANTLLTFGEDVATEAYLLGEMEGRGLQQLLMMMKPARISTGIFALGLASCAYETAVEYSHQRIQGKKFDQSMSARAPSLLIAEHPDVHRMRLEMAGYTMGCRSLLARLGHDEAILADAGASADARRVAEDVSEVLLPLVKAYHSDTAWRVCETAIQTMGGVGYTRDYPAQQAARDCKVLSIWEGTNHIQALFLLRDKLGLCLRSHRLDTLIAQVRATQGQAAGVAELATGSAMLDEAEQALRAATAAIGDKVRRGQMNDVPEVAVELQAALGDYVCGWQLLEAAVISAAALPAATAEDVDFYRFKMDVAHHFLNRILPRGTATAHAIARDISRGRFAMVAE